MRRRRIVVGRRDPNGDRQRELASLRGWRGRRSELVRGPVQHDAVEPNDLTVVVCELAIVVVVRSDRV